MTHAELREALEAWRVGDRATLERLVPGLKARAEGIWNPAEHVQSQSRFNRARHPYDIELKRKEDGSYGI